MLCYCGPRARSIVAAAGDPRGKDRHLVRFERDKIGAISRREPAQHVIEPEEGRGMCRRKSQRVRQGCPQQANAILDGARHVECGPGERPIVRDAAAILHRDVFALQGESGAAPADGRHRIGDEQGTADATQGKAEDRGIDMHTVHDEAVPGTG